MTELRRNWDVIIIGAGPAGSNAAYHLAREGWAVLLLEKEAAPGLKKACGGLALTDLKHTLSLPAEVCEKEVGRLTFSIRGKEKVWSSSKPAFLSFRRREFDLFLSQRAVKAGAKLLANTRVLRARDTEVHIRDLGTGVETELGAKIIIYADGIPSLAWKDRGIGFSPGTPFSKALVYEVAAPGNSVDAVYFRLSPDELPFGYFWIFPKQNLLNVGVSQLHGTPGIKLTHALDRLCREHPLLADREIITRRAGLIPNRRASVIHGDNCLVIGDAGGLIDPVNGAGINNALVSGALAAQAGLVALERDRYDAGALSSYPRMWRKSAEGHWIAFWGLIFRALPFLNSHVSRESFARILRMNIFLSLRIYRLNQSF
jgi:digeranylgeranylglycerophospholipid reductase